MGLYTTFKTKKRDELKKSLGKKNIHQVPVLDKVVLTMGIGSLVTRKGMKDFSELQHGLATIAGQQPHMIYSKKAVSNFKLREGMPVMLRVTLRGEKAYDFIERLVTFVLPRVRDFEGVSARKFDGQGNYSFGFKDYGVFPELNPESVKTTMGLQVSIVTSTASDDDAKAMLQSLGVIFQKPQVQS